MRKKWKAGKIITVIVALVVVMGSVFGGATMLERMHQRRQEQALLQEAETLKVTRWTDDNTMRIDGDLYGFDHRIETYLFIGTDNTGNSDPDDYRGSMADFLLLMVLDHTDNTVACLQIDRNTVMDIRVLNRDGQAVTTWPLQICTAHGYGNSPEMAAENTVYAVENYLGGFSKIDGYFVMNIQDVGSLNHSVGGVEITVLDRLDEDNPSLRQGETLTLTDEQAAYFLRVRMAVGKGTNVERLARQRQYMGAFFNKVKEKTLDNPSFGLELWNTLRSIAVSDMNGNCFSRIAQKLLKGTDRGIFTIKGETILGYVYPDEEQHEEFYASEGAIREVMTELLSLTKIEEEEPTGKEDDA